MWIVAVAALHEPFVNAVMKRARELLLCFEMTAVAQLWLLLFHQELAFLRIMRRVAVRAADVVLQMGGARKITVLFAVGVTAKTTLADFLCGDVLKAEDFRFVASAVDVGLPWTVTCLAAMPLGPLPCIQSRDVVRRIFIALEEAFGWHVFMAGLAGFGSDVKRRVGGTLVRFRLACGLRLTPVLLRSSGDNQNENQPQSSKNGNANRKVATNRLKHSHPPLLPKFRPKQPAGPQCPFETRWSIQDERRLVHPGVSYNSCHLFDCDQRHSFKIILGSDRPDRYSVISTAFPSVLQDSASFSRAPLSRMMIFERPQSNTPLFLRRESSLATVSREVPII